MKVWGKKIRQSEMGKKKEEKREEKSFVWEKWRRKASEEKERRGKDQKRKANERGFRQSRDGNEYQYLRGTICILGYQSPSLFKAME